LKERKHCIDYRKYGYENGCNSGKQIDLISKIGQYFSKAEMC